MKTQGLRKPADSEIAEVIAYHEGDMQAAIRTLLDDVRHLRQQLAFAEGAMSHGMTRGWRPSYDRD
ncbi:hypothetical protein RHEC894_CH03260 [Rhizobium sp. CIAT894]|uniref:hypothetical protein n=1 Tax=Rhizobium sp. CIAT894 TaxID=2020312 RepID=UPI000A1F15AA|nr:hypothetical protein [Rhizobium sp. CIAT894]ARM89532.1 hypothetical protein RHEC894_CH03260 [Rhizobium sp. CIAT894]